MECLGVSSPGIFLRISGWAFSDSDPVQYVIVHSDVLFRSPLVVLPLYPRVDVAAAFGLDRGKCVGFIASVNLLGCSKIGYLDISCVCASGVTRFQKDASYYSDCYVRLGRIHFDLTLPEMTFRSACAPLFVVSLGRSGSTALMKALGASDHIGVAGSHPLENRTVSYFIHMLNLLVTPSSDYLPAATAAFLDIPFMGSTNPFLEPRDWPEMNTLVSRNALTLISSPLRRLLEEHASCVGSATGKERVSYLAEKLVPNTTIPPLAKMVWPGAVEVLLIREFDDWLRSALAFSERTGQYFGSGVPAEELISRIVREVHPFIGYFSLRAEDAICVRYEDLVRDTEGVCRRLCDEIEVEFCERMVEAVAQAEPRHITAGQHASFHSEIAGAASIRELRSRYNDVLGYQ
jgi:hypothetical protein